MIAPSTSNTNKSTHIACASAPVGGCSCDSVPEMDVPTLFFEAGAQSPESSSPGGKHSPKAQAFWARKAALRKQPHRCTRCAKPHDGGGQCAECKAYAAQYRARKRADGLPPVEPKTLAALEKRVANLEHYFAQLSTANRVAYNRGYIAGRRLHRKAAERASYFDAMPRASAQDLAEISHVYAR